MDISYSKMFEFRLDVDQKDRDQSSKIFLQRKKQQFKHNSKNVQIVYLGIHRQERYHGVFCEIL